MLDIKIQTKHKDIMQPTLKMFIKMYVSHI